MVDGPKLVLMIQPNRLQGLIWQTVLKSQKISAIQESPDSDLSSSLSELKQAGLTLPDLLLIDINNISFNPYSFCRSCREQHPEVQVVLTNSTQNLISPPERQWAINQGAADLLPGLQADNLVSSVAASTKRILEVMNYSRFDNAALISTLLKIKRELDARRVKDANGTIADAMSMTEPAALPANPQPQAAPQNGTTAPSQPANPPTQNEPPATAPIQMKRRYRGNFY